MEPPPRLLPARLRELQELVERIQQQQEGAPGLPPQPAFSAAEQDDLRLRIAEAAEALGKLQVIIQGPPEHYQELVSGEHAQVGGGNVTLAGHPAACCLLVPPTPRQLPSAVARNKAAHPRPCVPACTIHVRALLLCIHTCAASRPSPTPCRRYCGRAWSPPSS